MSGKARTVLVLTALAALALASLAGAEVVQRGNLRVSFNGRLTPKALPRKRDAPVRVAVQARIASVHGGTPPPLRKILIAINRHGHFHTSGLPICTVRDIQPSTTQRALETCGDSLVGKGTFSADVALGRQAPFPAAGTLYAFNGSVHGRAAILAHVYGTDPVPTSFTFPFVMTSRKGTFGTALTASLPAVTGGSAAVTGLSLDLGRSYRSGGGKRSYLSASCAAPEGFPGAGFTFAKAVFSFGRRTLSSTLTRHCRVRG